MFFKILIFSDVPYSRGGSLLYSPTWIAEEICAAEPVLEYGRPHMLQPYDFLNLTGNFSESLCKRGAVG